MKHVARLLNPWTWAKVLSSSIALYVNAIQLSEVAGPWGEPPPEFERYWRERAAMVAFEGRQIRRHFGALEE